MRYDEEERSPRLIDGTGIVVALALHVAFFGCCWLLSMPFREKEIVVPIELTFEAPPSMPEEPQPAAKPEPKPVAKPKPPEPKPEPPKLEDPKLDAVVREPPPKKKPEKKPEVRKPPEKPKAEEKPKAPEKPAKTAAEIRQERLAQMRKSTTKDNTPRTVSPAPSGTGKTLSKDWKKLMDQGYRPGATTQLAASETQRCISLIRKAFHDRWEPPAWNSSMRMMYLEVTFDNGGRVVGYRLVQSSGDGRADQSVLSAASRVGSVAGLSLDFLSANRKVRIDFKVTPQ